VKAERRSAWSPALPHHSSCEAEQIAAPTNAVTKALGLTIPPSFHVAANEVIE